MPANYLENSSSDRIQPVRDSCAALRLVFKEPTNFCMKVLSVNHKFESQEKGIKMESPQNLENICNKLSRFSFPFITSIAAALSDTRGVHIGSGLRCMKGNRRFILSAAHVIKYALESHRHFLLSAGYGEIPVYYYGDVYINNKFDIAACWLPDALLREMDSSSFFNWEDETVIEKPDNKAPLFAHGFPGIRSNFNKPMMGLSNKSLPYLAVEQQFDGLPSNAMEYNFGLNYGPEHIKLASGDKYNGDLDPHGLSGSPVWTFESSKLENRDSEIDTIRLVGILIEYHEHEDVLLAINQQKIQLLVDGLLEGSEKISITEDGNITINNLNT